jgi:hypothetical protein
MATKPTSEQSAMRILWLMVHKFQVRENQIAHQGQFLTTFPCGAFQAADFKPGADYAVLKGWVEPAQMGALPALRLTTAGFAAAPERKCQMATSAEKALRLLTALYDHSRRTNSPLHVYQLAPTTGFTEQEAEAAWQYLADKGLIKTYNIRYTASINAHGIDVIEKARQYPDQPMPAFGSVTYNTINIHHMQGSSIQQAGSQSAQVQSTAYTSQDLTDLRRALEMLEQHFDELSLGAADKKKAIAQIATLKAQLSAEPNHTILREAGRTLRNITEGTIGGLIASAATSTDWHFISDILARLFGG